MSRHRVVIVGSGFGGLFAAKRLKHADAALTMIARTGHHLFQPLLYQVATGILSSGEVAPSARDIFKNQPNIDVLLGLVEDIDPDEKIVYWRNHNRQLQTPYDSLIVAAGSGQSYFGNDHFARFAPGMKSIDDALELRARIYGAFELAELETDPSQVDKLLTFVVVGAGATGVEMAGQIKELAAKTLPGEFRNIDPARARVILVDGVDTPLPGFGDRLGDRTKAALEKLGIELKMGNLVTDIDADSVTMKDKDGNQEVVPCVCKVWAAGVQASPLGKVLHERTGVEIDKTGRVRVEPDLSVKGYPDVFVVGDLMAKDGVPGMAQGAIQSSRFAADIIAKRLRGEDTTGMEFTYLDKGSMAIIAKYKAVADVAGFKFDGFIAWLAWLGLHLFYITGFKARFSTLIRWGISFLSNERSARTTTNQQMVARLALGELGRGASGRLLEGEDLKPAGQVGD